MISFRRLMISPEVSAWCRAISDCLHHHDIFRQAVCRKGKIMGCSCIRRPNRARLRFHSAKHEWHAADAITTSAVIFSFAKMRKRRVDVGCRDIERKIGIRTQRIEIDKASINSERIDVED